VKIADRKAEVERLRPKEEEKMKTSLKQECDILIMARV
jgi:hypothetical protein